MRAKRGGVDVDRVAPRRFDDRDAGLQKMFPQVGHTAQPIFQVMLVEHLDETLRHRFEIAPGQAAIGDKTFGKNQ